MGRLIQIFIRNAAKVSYIFNMESEILWTIKINILLLVVVGEIIILNGWNRDISHLRIPYKLFA